MEVLSECRAVPVISKNDLFVISLHFLLFDNSNPSSFQMCFIRRTKAYPCPNMINFDAVDFSECRSDMFLLMLSVVIAALLRLMTCWK